MSVTNKDLGNNGGRNHLNLGKSAKEDYEEQRSRHAEEQHQAEMAESQQRLESSKNRDAREAERDANEEARNTERNEQDMENSRSSNEMLLQLAGIAVSMAPMIQKYAEVGIAKMEFGDDASIRASACALIKKAAEGNGSEEALIAASERLMELSGYRAPAKK